MDSPRAQPDGGPPESQVGVRGAGTTITITPAAMLDLNPTGFVDDLTNMVEVHSAAAFDDLDSALRASLKDSLTPEQLTVLLQGTAGLYQDLRAEVKNRVQVFEEYSLAEILRLPPGLLADLVDSGVDIHDDGQLDISEEEERKLDDTLTTLRQEIAARKRRTREINAAITALDARMKTTEARLAALRAVPSAVAGQGQGLLADFKVIAERGTAVQVHCDTLEATIPMNEGGDKQGNEPALNDLDLMEREDDAKAFVEDNEDAEELQAEKEISRRYLALAGNQMPSASHLRQMREALGMV